jgi:succinoglycan biosynthesis protein ExoM
MQPLSQTSQRHARVAVCIATFKRPELLKYLLAGISKLAFEKMPSPEISVVVVDNDAGGSAEGTCRATQLPWPIKYIVEPHRGIAQARNRAIKEAGRVDFISFLDDDEIPTPAWLDELLWAQACFGADVVCGSVLPRFANGVPDWVRTGGFFDRTYDSGCSLDTCGAGNVLITSRVFTTVTNFDERFALTGAEDWHFFLRVRRAGYAIVSSSGAVVHESVSASRASLTGVLRRAYYSGNSWVLCESCLDGSVSTRILRMTKACGRILQGMASTCLSPFLGRVALAKGLRGLCLGAGMLTALAGRSYNAYEAPDTNAAEG